MKNAPRPLKQLGQHYLRDLNVIKKICDACTKIVDFTLEVGPGPGILTPHLITPDHKKVYVIEKDPRFIPQLEKLLPENHIYQQDALDFDWQNFLVDQNLQNQQGRLVSNLPYNVGVPLVRAFLPWQQIRHLTLMLQKEVSEKITMEKETTSIGSLLFAYFDIDTLCNVAPGAFHPPPKVQSQVFTLSRRSQPLLSYEHIQSYESFLRQIFAQKRKQLKKKVEPFLSQAHEQFPHIKLDMQSIFQLLQLRNDERAEKVPPDKIIELYKTLFRVS